MYTLFTYCIVSFNFHHFRKCHCMESLNPISAAFWRTPQGSVTDEPAVPSTLGPFILKQEKNFTIVEYRTHNAILKNISSAIWRTWWASSLGISVLKARKRLCNCKILCSLFNANHVDVLDIFKRQNQFTKFYSRSEKKISLSQI